MPGLPHDTAARVLALAGSRAPTLGGGRLVCVDGPAGSGKTTLATALARARADVRVVHMDDLYDGWGGLPRVGAQLAALLGPLASGVPGHYRRFDWHAGRYAETVEVPPGPMLVLEGVGSGARAHAGLTTVLVWVTAPEQLRLHRGLARDGAEVEPQWRRWMADEAAHFAAQGTEQRADLVVDETAAGGPAGTT